MKNQNKYYHIMLGIFPVISLGCFIALWYFVAAYTDYRIPNLTQVWERFLVTLEKPIAKKSIFEHAGISLLRVVKALLCSIVLGIPLGLMMGWNKTFRGIGRPVFEAIRPIPPIAWIPLITMWFGIGELPKIIIIFLGTFVPIVVNSYTGVAMVPRLNTDAGKIFGADGRYRSPHGVSVHFCRYPYRDWNGMGGYAGGRNDFCKKWAGISCNPGAGRKRLPVDSVGYDFYWSDRCGVVLYI